MLKLNFYKIRTGIDIRPLLKGGDEESQARYEQLIQTISQKADIEYLTGKILEVIEKSPYDLGAHKGKQLKIYILIFGVDKERSSWTGSDLKTTLGNMQLTARIKEINPEAEEWVGGLKNNISAEAALFDLRTKKRKK